VRGGGFLNSVLAKIPFELHLPGYNYCGPNTRLEQRLASGQRGINPLDAACMLHDIAYSKYKDTSNRHKADIVLADAADKRLNAKDATFGEKVASWIVSKVMRGKVKIGASSLHKGDSFVNRKMKHVIRHNVKKSLGCRKRKNRAIKQKKLKTIRGGGEILQYKNNFRAAVQSAKNALKKGGTTNLKKASIIALRAAKKVIKPSTRKQYLPRVIPIPKRGGFLSLLLPIFSAVSALGAMAGGAAGIASAVDKANQARKMLAESQRHNRTMEDVAVKGGGLYLRPYKSGLGLYLTSKNY
jgi:hypothetical protein